MTTPTFEREVSRRKLRQERWATTRQRGVISFIVRRGIGVFGVLFATLRLVDRYFEVLPGSHWRGVRYELVSFALGAVFFGSMMGYWVWR